MSSTTKIQNKGQVTIPTRVREQAGLSKGDVVEFSYQRGKIVITPKVVIDRSRFPNAVDEYTPEQRRAVDREIAKGLADVKSGRTFGPFDTAEEAIALLQAGPPSRRRFLISIAARQEMRRGERSLAGQGESLLAVLFQD